MGLTSKNNLASTLVDLGALEEAKTLYQEVLEARQRTLGAEHPNTLRSKDNLALTLRRLEQKVLEARQRTLGSELLAVASVRLPVDAIESCANGTFFTVIVSPEGGTPWC